MRIICKIHNFEENRGPQRVMLNNGCKKVRGQSEAALSQVMNCCAGVSAKQWPELPRNFVDDMRLA